MCSPARWRASSARATGPSRPPRRRCTHTRWRGTTAPAWACAGCWPWRWRRNCAWCWRSFREMSDRPPSGPPRDPAATLSVFLADEEATLRFASRLARAVDPSGEPLVLYLSGDLGAGKTTLARGLLEALGERGPVRSPTYALLAEYQPPGHRVLHLDPYRLDDP